MGWYIQCPESKNKAKQLVDLYQAELVSKQEAENAIDDPTKGIVVVLDNGPFEAAGFAYDSKEFAAFTISRDTRTKWFLIMDRGLVKQLTNYSGD